MEYHKNYREENREKILKQKKKYREENKELIKGKSKVYYEENKELIKDYREKNKELIKDYREKNKEKRAKKITCDCGVIHSLGSKSRHLKTKVHQDFVNNVIKPKSKYTKKLKIYGPKTKKETKLEKQRIEYKAKCECGGFFNHGYSAKFQHEKSIRHKKFILESKETL